MNKLSDASHHPTVVYPRELWLIQWLFSGETNSCSHHWAEFGTWDFWRNTSSHKSIISNHDNTVYRVLYQGCRWFKEGLLPFSFRVWPFWVLINGNVPRWKTQTRMVDGIELGASYPVNIPNIVLWVFINLELIGTIILFWCLPLPLFYMDSTVILFCRCFQYWE